MTEIDLTLDDSEVVVRVLGGESSLFEILICRYNGRLLRIIRSVIADHSEAEDALQNTWVLAFEHLAQFEGRSSFVTWATKIALHSAVRRERQGRKLVALEHADGRMKSSVEHRNVRARDPESQALDGEVKAMLQSSVDRLPDSCRPVFILREVEQMNTAETAECLNLSEEAVKTRLRRARLLLRKDLEDRLGAAIADCYPFIGQRGDFTVAAVSDDLALSPLNV